MRIRGLVLAAGRAQRLSPLSDSQPKPLLPFKGTPVLVRTLTRLAEAGCDALAVNLHHLGSSIREAVGDSIAGVPVMYSEESSVLGTLGALGPLRDFLSSADLVLVVNGDTLCEWPVEQLVIRHRELDGVCTLLFSRRAQCGDFGGGVLLEKEKKVLSFTGTRPEQREEARRTRYRFVFAGSYVLDPTLLRRVVDGYSDLVPGLLDPLLREEATISALVYDGVWHDFGTPGRYLEASLREAAPWTHTTARVGSGCRVEGSVVEDRVRLEENVEIVDSVLLPGARVGVGTVLSRCVVGPGVGIPPRRSFENQLLTSGGTSAGDLCLTPLG